MEDYAIEIDHVTIRFNMASEKVDNLKEQKCMERMLNVTSWLMEMIPIQRNTENKWQIWCSKKERIWW